MTKQYSVVDGGPGQFDFELLVEECLAAIYVIRGNHFIYVNPVMAQIFGYTPEELVATATVEALVDPTDRERVLENLRLRFEGDAEVLQYSFHALRRDGTTFEAEVRGRRIDVGGVPAVAGTLLDLTERHQELDRLRFLSRAAELLDSSLQYETTLESLARLMIPSFADLCVIDIRYDGTVRRLVAEREVVSGGGLAVGSAEPEQITEADSIESLMGSDGGILLETVSQDRRGEIATRIPSHLSDGEETGPQSVVIVPLIARGNRIGAMLLATAGSGRAYRSNDFEFAREVARAAALAVDNAHLYQVAQQAIDRREEVLAIVSHDLRNPLNAILMSTSIALDQDRRRQGPLARVHNAAKQMERLIRDLLDACAIDAGGFSVDPTSVVVASVVEKTIELHEELASARSVSLQSAIHDPGLEICADEDRLVQALSNLVGNALRFTPPGGVVKISSTRENGTVDLAVADSGPGIPDDEVDTVFDRFWRGRSGGGEGAGLGLAIVKGIAEAHGGHVRVESKPGTGSTFHLELPANS